MMRISIREISLFGNVNLCAFGGDAIEPDAMTWAVAEGIVEGMDGNLNPAGHATRAQIATILMRFCETVAE